jgi:hypothetical protein
LTASPPCLPHRFPLAAKEISVFSCSVATVSRRFFVAALTVAGLFLPQAASADSCKYFIEVSMDGLGSVYLQPMIAKGQLPNFRRFQTEGAWTNNARDDDDVTVTLPNHTTMMTGRSVMGPCGHHYTNNTDPARGETLHNQKHHDGTYIASVFDVAHDHGLRTALATGKAKFSLFRDSYDANHGAVSAARPDCGRNKIDFYVYDKDCEMMTTRFIAAMHDQPFNYAFVHYADPDVAGHAHGWGGAAYQQTIRKLDAQLGRLFQLVESSPQLRGRTTIFLTADHGGKDRNHANNLLPEVYTIPVYVWGCGVATAKDLYALNVKFYSVPVARCGGRLASSHGTLCSATRRNPGTCHPLHTDPVQPVRNGDGANLALKLFGLGPIPGSTINVRQDLAIGP